MGRIVRELEIVGDLPPATCVELLKNAGMYRAVLPQISNIAEAGTQGIATQGWTI